MERQRRLGLLSLIGFVIIGFVWLGASLNNLNYGRNPSPPPRDPGAGHEIAAWQTCRDLVRERLRSPASAEFASYHNSTVRYRLPATYTVSGTVDAQNAFGATIRTAYTCTLTWDAQGWQVERVEL